MINQLISLSLKNSISFCFRIALFAWGSYAISENPIRCHTDLSDNQVIVFTEWQGHSPQIMEDQVTYPLVSNLQGIPKVKAIRATSMFGMSFVYIVFEDKADIYWARSRVLERLSYAQRLLPQGITPRWGRRNRCRPYFMVYAERKRHEFGRTAGTAGLVCETWFANSPGVSEVASFGGFEKQYQVTIDPNKLNYYNIPLSQVLKAVKAIIMMWEAANLK